MARRCARARVVAVLVWLPKVPVAFVVRITIATRFFVKAALCGKRIAAGTTRHMRQLRELLLTGGDDIVPVEVRPTETAVLDVFGKVVHFIGRH